MAWLLNAIAVDWFVVKRTATITRTLWTLAAAAAAAAAQTVTMLTVRYGGPASSLSQATCTISVRWKNMMAKIHLKI